MISSGPAMHAGTVASAGIVIAALGYAALRRRCAGDAQVEDVELARAQRRAAASEMSRLKAVAGIPFVSQGELVGYLLLGDKTSGEGYSKEDLRLLRIVANQAAVAYQRVQYLEAALNGARADILGDIASGFAHEIKTPLANISLPAEMSLTDLEDLAAGRKSVGEVAPKLKSRMKDIMDQVFKASEKIEAVRQFSKPGRVRMEAVHLRDVVQNSLALLDHLLRKTGVQIVQQFPEVLAPVRADAKQLEIVFVNLIKNAAEAMNRRGADEPARELTIGARDEGEWIVIRFKDSGPGILKTHFGRLFEAYFTTKGSEGTGMGLFLSHHVIKAHGGSIDVESEEGKGTEFIIRLPKFTVQERDVHHAA